MPDPIRTRGITAHTTPRHSTRPPGKRQGDTNTQTGRSASRHPPFHHNATPASQYHPTIHDSPTLHHDEGGSRQRIPHHTNTTDTHTARTPHTQQQTVRDMTAVLTSTAPGWAGRGLGYTRWADSSSTHHRHSTHHTPRRMDTIHRLTSHCSRSHNQRTIMINVDQRSSFND